MNPVYEKLMKAYNCVKEKIDFQPEIALVMGSGLGGFAADVDVKEVLPFSEIEGFPVSTVPEHAGQYVFGYVEGVPVVLMQGRVHMYEGYDVTEVVMPIRLMGLMGAKVLFLTNAAGGFNDSFYPGMLMLITDHIASFVPNPLTGPNIDELGTRFPDMSGVYDEQLQDVIRYVASRERIRLKEGVYVQLPGPSFETPAEIRMLKALGASACGMSTAVEAIAANHMGMRICGISCITNMAAGISRQKLTQAEVFETANRVGDLFQRLLRQAVIEIHETIKPR